MLANYVRKQKRSNKIQTLTRTCKYMEQKKVAYESFRNVLCFILSFNMDVP